MDRSRIKDTVPLPWQIEVRRLLDLAEKHRRPNIERRADVKDGAQGRVGLAAFNQADKGPLVPRFRSQRILAHLLAGAARPQQLAEDNGRIGLRVVRSGSRHTPLWHRKYITRCV